MNLFWICILGTALFIGCNEEDQKSLGLAFAVQDLTNPGEPDGSIALSISGGTEPYQVKWSTGDSVQNLNELFSGMYNVTVTDAVDDSICDSTIVEGPAVLLYFGQSYFEIISPQGVRIATDPSTTHMPGSAIRGHADILSTSHFHSDHTATGLVKNYTIRLRPGTVDTTISYRDVSVVGFESEHGMLDGQAMGSNTIYIFTVGDIRIAHLGENREITEPEILEALEGVDILLAPAGEAASMSVQQIFELADKVNAKTVIPHHYCYDANDGFYGSTTIDEFLLQVPANYEVIESDMLLPNKADAGKKVIYLHPATALL